MKKSTLLRKGQLKKKKHLSTEWPQWVHVTYSVILTIIMMYILLNYTEADPNDPYTPVLNQ